MGEHAETMEALTTACQTFALLTQVVGDAEIAHALATVEMADAVGPILDPTAWNRQAARGGLDRQARLLRALSAFRAELRAVFPDGWP